MIKAGQDLSCLYCAFGGCVIPDREAEVSAVE